MREVISGPTRGYKLPKAPEMQEWCEEGGVEPEIRQMQRFLLDLRTQKNFRLSKAHFSST